MSDPSPDPVVKLALAVEKCLIGLAAAVGEFARAERPTADGGSRPVAPQEILDTQEAADFLGLTKSTLMNWRRTKLNGPRFIQMGDDGRSVRYRMSDLIEFLETKTKGPLFPPKMPKRGKSPDRS